VVKANSGERTESDSLHYCNSLLTDIDYSTETSILPILAQVKVLVPIRLDYCNSLHTGISK